MSEYTSIIEEDLLLIINKLTDKLNKLTGKTILITGSSGFLCSYIVDTLAKWNESKNHKKKCRLICLDNNITGPSGRLKHLSKRKDVEFISHDVSKPLRIQKKVDFIIHGASIASPSIYRKFPLETIDANVNGTRNILELSKKMKVKKVLVMSTSEIYGDPSKENIPTKETYNGNVSYAGPRSCYDESKRLAETLCYIYKDKFGIPVNTIRPFNVFGPGQRLDDKRIIPDLMSAIINNKPIILYSDGKATRSFCYISDAIVAILLILLNKNNNQQGFNVGNDEIEISMKNLANLMLKVGGGVIPGSKSKVIYKKSLDKYYNSDNPQRRAPDLSTTKFTLDWEPEVNLYDALKRTLVSNIEFIKKN